MEQGRRENRYNMPSSCCMGIYRQLALGSCSCPYSTRCHVISITYILTGVYSCTPDALQICTQAYYICYLFTCSSSAAQGQPRRLRHSQQLALDAPRRRNRRMTCTHVKLPSSKSSRVFKGHIVTAGCKEFDIEGNIIIAYLTQYR